MGFKYIGSKGKLIDQILPYIPEQATVVYEPFSGSASLSLSQDLPFYLSDTQPELVNFLQCVKEAPVEVSSRVAELGESVKTTEAFLALRAADRREGFLNSCPYSRAARYYFILYRGYNGLYRVNGKGQCNTPFGGEHQKLPKGFESHIELISKELQRAKGIELLEFDNEEILPAILDSGEKPFVFIDPPYYGTFDQYVKDRPNPEFWERLKKYTEDLNEAGIPFLLTNSDDPFILELFKDSDIELVPIKYTVAADKTKRVTKQETFISNKSLDTFWKVP